MTSLCELFFRRAQSRSLWILAAAAMIFGGCTPSDNKNAGQPKATSPNSDSASSVSSAKPTAKRIILLNNTDSPFWDAARAGINKAQADLKLADSGFSASMDSNDGTETGQIEKLRQYGTQKDIAAVIISPISSTNPAIADELKNLKNKGITIGCFDSDLDAKYQQYREFYVGTNNIAGGKVLGTAAKMLKPQGAPYVQFVGVDSQQNAIERMDGFTSAVGESFVQKDRKLDDADRNRARDNVRDVITKYPDLSVLVGIWSYNAPAIVDVVKEKNARDKFTIVTFDAEAIAIQQMADGMIDAMVVQNPFAMGYESVRYAFAKAMGDPNTPKQMFPNLGKAGGDILDTGLKVVVPPGSPLKAEMFESFGKSVEFIDLPTFQEWLKKYDLTSS
ncbi:MAG: substrate-binding domain-containing protein [Planctomycetota bacterium]|jgi:ribose transport system substrate-binding protein